MKVPFSYLDRQFADLDAYLDDLRKFVPTGDFTLGKPLAEFERRFAEYCRMPHAIGVGSGTDALILSLKACGVGPGDEVITTTTTFVATVGAIVATGATPVFVDSEDGFVIDATKIEAAITPRTRALLPVHFTGNLPDMPAIEAIAKRHNLSVVEDACQAIGGEIDGKPSGSWSTAAGYSLHPLKNLNVWSDGGIITTRDESLAKHLRLFRNHGLRNRDEVEIFGVNSRLDTLQAVIGNRLIGQVKWITGRRIEVAMHYDRMFSDVGAAVRVPKRRPGVKHVFHLYMLRVEKRDELLEFLNSCGIEAKIHYPIPMHLQPASKSLGYGPGDFPVSEGDAKCIITLPAHQHLTEAEIGFVVEQVRAFTAEGSDERIEKVRVDLDVLVRDYLENLNTQLRAFNAAEDFEFLSTFVPSDDATSSMLDLIDLADDAAMPGLTVAVSTQTERTLDRARLKKAGASWTERSSEMQVEFDFTLNHGYSSRV